MRLYNYYRMIKTHHTAKTEMGKEGKIQSMLFSKAKWTVSKAKTWLSEHGYKNDDVDDKDKHLRFRQVSPSYMESKGYDFITRPFGTSGIQAIIGYKNKDPIDVKKEEREDLMLDKIKQVADDIRDLRAVHGTGVLDKIHEHLMGRGVHSSTGEGIIERAKKTLGMGISTKNHEGMTTKKFTKGSQEAKDHMAKIRSMKKN